MLNNNNTVVQYPEVVSRLRGAFPHSLATEINATLPVIPTATIQPTNHDIGPIKIEGESIRIPYRIYSPEPDNVSVSNLSDLQRVILSCLYTRHHNGYVREKFLPQVLKSSESWVPPFVFQLIGEYVEEIIQIVASNIQSLRDNCYTRFASENPEFINLIRQRIISYWACYVSRPPFRDCIGYQVMNDLGLWGKHAAKRLLSR